LWFEDSPEPLIYLVEIVHGPVSVPRAVSQYSGREEAAQVTAYANRRKQESRSAASRQQPTISVKPVAADTGLPSVNPSLKREPAIMPSRGRYDGHAPWPAASRKSLPGAVPIGFDGISAGHAKTPR
jgi:hypothetical protein